MPPETVEAESDAALDAMFDEAARSVGPADLSPEPQEPEPPLDPLPEPEPAQPEAAPEATPQPSPGADASAQAAPVVQTAPDDIWANASPELRALFQTEQKRANDAISSSKRLKGQLSSRDRQYAELEAKHRVATSQPAATGQSTKEMLASDLIAKLREDYGEIAEPMINIIEAQQQQIDGLTGSVKDQNEARASDYVEAQLTRYEQAHPDWQDYANHTGWQDWIAGQPRMVREAAARNADYITDADEASDLLTRFKSHLEAQKPAPPTPDPKREAQLAGARNVSANGPAAIAAEPDDPDAMWASAAAKVDRQRLGQLR